MNYLTRARAIAGVQRRAHHEERRIDRRSRDRLRSPPRSRLPSRPISPTPARASRFVCCSPTARSSSRCARSRVSTTRFFYAGRAIDPFSERFSRDAADVVTTYTAFEGARRNIETRLRHHVRPAGADDDVLRRLARPDFRQSTRRADPSADPGDRRGRLRQSLRASADAPLRRRSRPSRRHVQQDDAGTAASSRTG